MVTEWRFCRRFLGDKSVITRQVIDLEKFMAQKSDPSCGASVVFVGKVRNHHAGRMVKSLFYECYEAMAEKQVAWILERARKSGRIHYARAIHRVGKLEIGDIAVVVEVSSTHRNEAFEACRTIIDAIKSEVPIWKKETYLDGQEEWVSCAHSATDIL